MLDKLSENFPGRRDIERAKLNIQAALIHSATSFRPWLQCQQQKFVKKFHITPVNHFLINLWYGVISY